MNQKRDRQARGSRLTAQIAAVSGLCAEWLATGKGEKFVSTIESPAPVPVKGHHVAVLRKPVLEGVEMVELTRAAVELAQAALDLKIKGTRNYGSDSCG